jgi:histidyl-tRNA synthetase
VSDATAKKEERRKFQAIRGTRDLLPPETALWNRVEQTAHEVFTTFGYGEIRLPVLENIELFARSIGGETDIVGKEMFSFEEFGWTAIDTFRREIITTNPIELRKIQTLASDSVKVKTERFLTALNEAVDRGEIKRTPETVQALAIVPQKRDELLAALATGDIKWSDKELTILWGVIQQAVKNVRLGDQVALRPEATASVCRAYIEHNMQQLPQPVKLYYTGPMFRRERPQKGRYRQFYQIGAEILGGTDAPAIDAEVIEMLMTYFDRVGLQGATLYINSIGHNADNCRRGYVANLKSALEKVKDKLGPDSQRRIDTNPLRVLDSKLESEQAIIATLPHIADHLCDECKTHYAEVKRQLEVRGVLYQENWRLVRGLDYYMRTTFEITAPGLGSQNAVCGGGRYDGLVELLGGPPTKGIGFAIGEDRLILSLQESGKGQVQQGRDVYIAWMGERAYAAAIRAAKDLRSAGFSAELPPLEQKFGKALGQADKLGAKYALILGDNEVSEGLWTIKTLSTGEQQKLPEPDLIEFLRTQKNVSS